MLLLKDRVGYLDNAPKRRAKAPEHTLKSAGKGALRAFRYKAVIRKRFLAHSGLLVPTSENNCQDRERKISRGYSSGTTRSAFHSMRQIHSCHNVCKNALLVSCSLALPKVYVPFPTNSNWRLACVAHVAQVFLQRGADISRSII